MASEDGNTPGTSNQMDQRQPEDSGEPIQRLNDKETLFMLLALHMEKSPLGKKPDYCGKKRGIKVNKTGIVVCESDSFQRILAMDCSRNRLHAVQLVTTYLAMKIKGCNVYLSRKPCTDCAKCLVQGGVESVFFWPKAPESCLTTGETVEDMSEVDQIFRNSSTLAVPHVPAIDVNVDVSKLCERTRRQKCDQCCSCNHEASLCQELEQYWDICGMPLRSSTDDMKCLIPGTVRSYCALLNCDHGECAETEDFTLALANHSLQLCFLLAARSDDPTNGVGAIIYNKKRSIIGAGYNGYIRKATYGNFPRAGRGDKRTRSKAGSMVHAEVNALLSRLDTDTDSAVLVCSLKPCPTCERMIIASGIKTVVSVKGLPHADNTAAAVGAEEPEKLKIILWECANEVQGHGSREIDAETEHQNQERKDGPNRLPKKADLMMYLALHMEQTPLCVEPKEKDNVKFCKAGITILNPAEGNRILAIDCSRDGLHAVQQALLSSPKLVQGCTVYLSRYPCIDCAKLLLQGGALHVCYWPNLEEQSEVAQKDNITKASQLFLEAKVICEMYIPLLDLENVRRRISPKAGVKPTPQAFEYTSFFNPDVLSENKLAEILTALGVSHIKKKDYRANFMKHVETAHACYNALINSPDGCFEPADVDDQKDLHTLQLCFLLAARSDSPGLGVGALICQANRFVGMGYNGFPRGNRYSHYLQSFQQAAKTGENNNANSGSTSCSLLICAEANALYLRHKQDLNKATLYCSTYPCSECLDLIKATRGITKIVCVKPKDKDWSASIEDGITMKMWEQNTGVTETTARRLEFNTDENEG